MAEAFQNPCFENKFRFDNVDDSLERYSGSRIALSFGGGIDSSAVRAIFPEAFVVHEAHLKEAVLLASRAYSVVGELGPERGRVVTSNQRYVSRPDAMGRVNGLPRFFTSRMRGVPAIRSDWPLRCHAGTFEFCDPAWRDRISGPVLERLAPMTEEHIAELERWDGRPSPDPDPRRGPRFLTRMRDRLRC